MKRSVLKAGFQKSVLLAVVIMLSAVAFAQLNQTGVHANFGVDADTRALFTKYGVAPAPNNSDDWFSILSTGRGVIDTSNTAYYLQQLQANRNISFYKNMSVSTFAGINNKLWLDAVYIRDYSSANGKDSTSFGSAAKNGMNPTSWDAAATSIPAKTDIIDAYAHLRRNGLTVQDSLWLFTGVSTRGTNGDRYFDIELYKKPAGYDWASRTFTTQGTSGGRTEWLFDAAGNIIQTGDLILSVSYKSGQAPEVDIRLWVSKTTFQNVMPRLFRFGSNYDGSVYGYASVVSLNNSTAFGSGSGNFSSSASDTTYSTPWGTLNTAGAWSAKYDQLQFVEIGINVTRIGIDPALYSNLGSCDRIFHSIFFKSRSSNSFSANLQDFAGPLQLQDPALAFVVSKTDTLTCDHPVAELSVTSSSATGLFSWSTTDGLIISANQDSTIIKVKKHGTYTMQARLASGCAIARTEALYVPTDSLPPVASADIAMTVAGNMQLLGGDPVASDVLTPFGRSKGLVWDWRGPNSFTSSQQNPIINDNWLWGSYYLTLKEQRNGCKAYAAIDVSFKANRDDFGGGVLQPGASFNQMSLQKIANALMLQSSQAESFPAVAVFHSTAGQLLGRQTIYINKGISKTRLNLASVNKLVIVSVYKAGELLFTRKINF